ncbi:3-oxoacyl-ACP synthase [Streptomyces alboflavus]|uniref:3-oxoacyl-ACP synthase n=1 Tax=Streptomyces alboflavus TaxID=67267 RepID=A0A1Z1W2L0_9ACTN|nr:3-oxoacyl-ACP synthase [Streptomyces alboflavus]
MVENAEIGQRFGINEEWVESRTGIKCRRHADPDETLVLMGAHAARGALEQAGLAASQVDCVLLASMSNVRQVPALAPAVARELGADNAGACDIQAACAGFTYGIVHAVGLIASGAARHVLVIASERLSDITDPMNRDTAVLFGDGAGAAVVSASQEPGFGPVVWGSDGTGEELFVLTPSLTQLDVLHPRPYIRMRGRALARKFGTLITPVIHEALNAAQLTWYDVQAFVPHQANLRFIRQWTASLDLPSHVATATAITDDGNTSAASIPLAIDHLMSHGAVNPGDLAVLLGYGVGITWAAMVARLPGDAEHEPLLAARRNPVQLPGTF